MGGSIGGASRAIAIATACACGPRAERAEPLAEAGDTADTTSGTTTTKGAPEASGTSSPSRDTASSTSTLPDATGESRGPDGLKPVPTDMTELGYRWVELDIHGQVFVLADFDGDTHVDIVAQSQTVRDDVWELTTHLGNGAADFTATPSTALEWGRSVRPADFDGDGHLELLVSPGNDPTLIGLQDGTGRFVASVHPELVTEYAWWPGAVLDADLDGRDDLVYFAGHSSPASVLVQTTDFVFVERELLPYPACYFELGVEIDVDDDGRDDLFAKGGCNEGLPEYSWYGLYRNEPDAFVVAQTFPGEPIAYEGRALAVTDFDDDGDLEILGATPDGLVVFVDVGSSYEVAVFAQAWGQWGPDVWGFRTVLDDRGAVVVSRHSLDDLILRRAGDDALEVDAVDLLGDPIGVADLDEDGFPDLVVRTDASDDGLGAWLSGSAG